MPDLFDENGFLDRMTGFTGGGFRQESACALRADWLGFLAKSLTAK